ncbi:MAG: DUF2891 domain-containing protein [Niabella sp.]
MRKFLLLLLVVSFQNSFAQTKLTKTIAENLSTMPLHCIETEFPNKTSHLSDGVADATLLPSQLHPVFYGCLDWHSSVHGHWMLIKLLKLFPNLNSKDSIITLLNHSFTLEKMQQEAAYFEKYTASNTFERTYGWAWLLKLDEELYTWDNPLAKSWHKALQPLTEKIVLLWKNYLPRQTYPTRTGTHSNTAFGLCFALDWARVVKDTAFERMIKEKSKIFYFNNKNIPGYLEPDGSDFFSPSLQAADLMRRVLPTDKFLKWFNAYYSPESIKRLCEAPKVSDRNDYQIVHLDGLSFSRAWCMKGIAAKLPANHQYKSLFIKTADKFLNQTLPTIFNGGYGGEHWLASFAVYALSVK